MTGKVEIGNVDRLVERYMRIGDPDATDLMLAWMRIADEGNRRGIMAGTDGRGMPMAPITYRPRPPVVKPSRRRGLFNPGVGGNLTSAEYRRLSGPPLAPRGMGSRVITNYKTDYEKLRPGFWQMIYFWDDVVSREGQPFLRYHFTGTARLPRRDLRGLRPETLDRVRRAKMAWVVDRLRSQ